MAGNISNYLENEILDHVTGRANYPKPSATYAALYTVAPTDSSGGTEVSGNNYTRIVIPWGAASGGSIANNANIVFPNPSGLWGTVVAVAILDTSTLGSGNILWYGPSSSITMTIGDTYTVSTGGLVLSLD